MIHKHERIVHGRVASEHIVQLFDSASSLADTVADFLERGRANDAYLLVVARADHWAETMLRLEARGFPVADAIAGLRLRVFDAATTLASFFRSGRIERELFDRTVGDTVRQQSMHGPVWVYGEMVDLLAEQGLFAEAESLEHLWNALLQECSVHLLCGYQSTRFTDQKAMNALHAICAAHTSVTSKPEDALASWALAERGGRFSTH